MQTYFSTDCPFDISFRSAREYRKQQTRRKDEQMIVTSRNIVRKVLFISAFAFAVREAYVRSIKYVKEAFYAVIDAF